MVVELRERKVSNVEAKTTKQNEDLKNPSWGRSSSNKPLTVLVCGLLFAFCPLLVIYFWMACDSYQCSLVAPVNLLAKQGFSFQALKAVLWDHFPKPTASGFAIYAGWLLFQGLLAEFLPGSIGYGQRTPAGHILPYKVNGLNAYLITHALFFVGSVSGVFPASVIHDNWGALLVATNAYGYFLTVFAYIKALYFPTHKEDCKWSGSFLYDMFMGVEFNPRFGKYFDFKLFHNGRYVSPAVVEHTQYFCVSPGIVAWTLINWSFAAAQYREFGYVTNSMLLVNWFHFTYVIDFFINEDWYLRTVDIAHDHFGFYLAWGDSVWLPYMYTLQTHYLARNPVRLSPLGAAAVFGIGMFGYYIFRAVNYQKDLVRRHDGNCNIWGKPAKYIRAQYTTSDGKSHSSVLLASGWWGVARHFNYTGDLVLSFAMCAACGFEHVLPWFYVIYMFLLLVSRIRRDDTRCTGKYGKYWMEYKELVPWNLIPYVY